MNLRRFSIGEIVSVGLTALFGLISLVGSVTIVLTPTGLNYTILAVLVSLILTGIGIAYIRRHNKLQRHRYRTLSSEIVVHCELGRRAPAGRLEPLCRVERKATIKPLHAFQQDLDISMLIDDTPGEDVFALSRTVGYACNIVSKKRGPIASTVTYDVPAKRQVKVKIGFESLHRGETFVWQESFLAPNAFREASEYYFTTVRNPTSEVTLRIVFRELEIIGAKYEAQMERQQSDVEAVPIRNLGNNTWQIEKTWHKPKVGQQLRLSWQWAPPSLERFQNR